MPTRAQIVSFAGDEAPPGASPWVAGRGPSPYVAVVEPDPSWPERSAQVAATVRSALGWRVLALEHVGSTAVAGLAAKPTLDLDLVLADPDAEDAYVPALEALGFVLTVREPWWQGHRLLRLDPPALGESLGCHLHVFGPDSAEPWKHRSSATGCARTPTSGSSTPPRSAPPPTPRARRRGALDALQRPQAGRGARDLRPCLPRRGPVGLSSGPQGAPAWAWCPGRRHVRPAGRARRPGRGDVSRRPA